MPILFQSYHFSHWELIIETVISNLSTIFIQLNIKSDLHILSYDLMVAKNGSFSRILSHTPLIVYVLS
jgi:hypothetical protein